MSSESRSIDVVRPLQDELEDIDLMLEVEIPVPPKKLDLRHIKKVVIQPLEDIEVFIDGDTV